MGSAPEGLAIDPCAWAKAVRIVAVSDCWVAFSPVVCLESSIIISFGVRQICLALETPVARWAVIVSDLN
jgi:hypothetical protein